MSRINGIHINLHTMTDAELLQGIAYAEARIATAHLDVAKFSGEIAIRAAVDPEPATQQMRY